MIDPDDPVKSVLSDAVVSAVGGLTKQISSTVDKKISLQDAVDSQKGENIQTGNVLLDMAQNAIGVATGQTSLADAASQAAGTALKYGKNKLKEKATQVATDTVTGIVNNLVESAVDKVTGRTRAEEKYPPRTKTKTKTEEKKNDDEEAENHGSSTSNLIVEPINLSILQQLKKIPKEELMVSDLYDPEAEKESEKADVILDEEKRKGMYFDLDDKMGIENFENDQRNKATAVVSTEYYKSVTEYEQKLRDLEMFASQVTVQNKKVSMKEEYDWRQEVVSQYLSHDDFQMTDGLLKV